MKQIILLILCLYCKVVFGQENVIPRDQLLFEKGALLQQLVDRDLRLDDIINSKDSANSNGDLAEIMKETILEIALKFYQKIVDSFPQSNLFLPALNNKGCIELALDEKDEARITFQRILDSDVDEKGKSEIGSGILSVPYANYMNMASEALAGIYIDDGNYTKALKYLDLTKVYSYKHFCGNELASNNIYICSMYPKCYIGLNKNKEAIKLLLPELLENGLTDNTDIVELAFSVLTKEYTKAELKAKFEEAFKNYHAEKIRCNTKEYDKYYIEFLDTKLELSSWRLDADNKEKLDAEIDKMCKRSAFYKKLIE